MWGASFADIDRTHIFNKANARVYDKLKNTNCIYVDTFV